MNFYYFYSLFLSFVDYLRKKILFVVVFLIFVILTCLFFYIQHSFQMESSRSFLKLINGKSTEFLEKKQHGVYENIRKSLLQKNMDRKDAFAKISGSNDVLVKYLKFINQMDGKFGDDFDSILEAESSVLRSLFISSKAFYNKYRGSTKRLPFFLNVFMQCQKGGEK